MRIGHAFLLTLAVPARLLAQEPAGAQPPDWSVNVGAMAFAYPAYPGSDEYRVVPFPLVDARFRDRAYVGPSSTGLGFAIGAFPVQSSHWRVAVELGGQDSRSEDRADALAGMDDRDFVATGGASLGYRSGPFEVTAAVSQGLNDGAGLIQTNRLTYSRPVGKVILGVAGGVVLANGKQMRREFGITEEEAARRQALVEAGDERLEPGDAQAYTPDGGLRHLGLGLSLIYPMASRWSLVGLAGVEWLADEAANSPLVRRREQFAGGLGVGYRF